MRIVGTVVVLAAFALVAFGVWRVVRGRSRGFPRRGFGRSGFPGRAAAPVTTVCLQCHGSGWITRRERTLQFTGDGFADVENPSTMCATCGGTGHRTR